MNTIEFIATTKELDIEKTGYTTVNNYRFANQIFHKNYVPPFFIPKIIDGEYINALALIPITINDATGVITEVTANKIGLDLANLSGLYFQGEFLVIAKYLTYKYYIIKITAANNYKSTSIFKVEPTVLKSAPTSIELSLVDDDGDIFVDDAGDEFIETI